jgi:hypothetical protein
MNQLILVTGGRGTLGAPLSPGSWTPATSSPGPGAQPPTPPGRRAGRGRLGGRRAAQRHGSRPCGRWRGGDRPLRQRPPRAAAGRHRRHPQPAPGRRNPAPGAHLHRQDRSRPYRYYQAKLQAERLIQTSGLPWTILRATQFHQLVLLVAEGLARLPVVPVPAATSFQPIDAAEVADRLAELAVGPPSGRVPDVGGPPDPAGHRPGARLPARDRAAPAGAGGAAARRGVRRLPPRRPPDPRPCGGRRTWEQFLTAQLGQPRPIGADRTTAEGRA